MLASKENAEKAIQFAKRPRQTKRTKEFIMDFLESAKRKLPSKAAYLRQKQRHKLVTIFGEASKKGVAGKSRSLRGHEIVSADGAWYFADTGEPTAPTWTARPCGYCNKPDTPEGHDGCLGTLPEVMNACCGHGVVSEAYVQFDDGKIIRGEKAAQHFMQLKREASP